ncbi:MAG: 3-deoxy-8-phosphooctulonate synthase [Planctomycetota bacterium]
MTEQPSPSAQPVALPGVTIGKGQSLAVIAGPCVAESFELCLSIGRAVRERCGELGLSYVFKASFDKANRSSAGSARGPGVAEGLAMIVAVGRELGVPVTTDIHLPEQAAMAAEASGGGVDLLQVPAFLCRQTDLLVACGATGRAVNIKKGQFMSPAEMGTAVEKVKSAAPNAERPAPNAQVMLTERGTFFGYHRLVNDFAGLGDLMEHGCPVCFDVTHSTQLPGATAGVGGVTSGGRPERAPLLARAAVAAGVDAVFIESHPDPGAAVSDGATMLTVDRTLRLLGDLAKLRAAMADFEAGA